MGILQRSMNNSIIKSGSPGSDWFDRLNDSIPTTKIHGIIRDVKILQMCYAGDNIFIIEYVCE